MRVTTGHARAAANAQVTEAILLAAGLSRRMGAVNKLLIDIAGKPMVRHAAETLTACGFEPIVVVGHQRAAVADALSGLPVKIVFNAEYEAGQATSVRAGIAALARDDGAVLIGLSDQPRLNPSDIEALQDAFVRSPGDRILVPEFQGRRGNPIIVPRDIIAAIDEGPVNFGCHKYIEANPSRILRFAARNDHFTQDIDTTDALAELAIGNESGGSTPTTHEGDLER